jgi:hypothetical protein
MSKYHIFNRNTFYEVREHSGIVTETSPALDWAVNLPFGYVRQYAERKGWKIIPVIERDMEVRTFEVNGNVYDIHHDGLRVCRVFKNDKEILWSDLPSILKGLI